MTRFVSRYVVTRVRRERAADGTHMHIAGVYAGGEYFPRQQVVRSLDLLNNWVARASGRDIPIDVVETCPYEPCEEAPYLRSRAHVEGDDPLETLPEF